MSKIKFSIITLFPEALQPYLDSSMLYKAQSRGIIEIEYVNLRDFGIGPHRSVDDTPYGGGDGMLMRVEPVFAAIETVKSKSKDAKVIVPTPVGQIWNQALAREFAGINQNYNPKDLSDLSVSAGKAKNSQNSDNSENTAPSVREASENLALSTEQAITSDHDVDTTATECQPRHYIIFCPHYEGYDERIMSIVDYPISLGEYVLTGGELPALTIIDSITRLLPGVLGGDHSATVESFSAGNNLEYPQYTKPFEFRGMTVPEVLLSGNHAKISEWRTKQSELRSKKR